ncbi:RloB family protein [Paenibacillus wenxiniae]|uniref:RloB family protein n=1 Tax=Paenibacillus wenxiniae TaxID=1636843 RepID=A0ABW4RH12_9BACL
MAARREPGRKNRKEQIRKAKPSGHLIVTEGIKTETNYFNGFKNEINEKYQDTVQSYTIDIHGAGKETLRIIEEIEDYKRRSPHIFEHIWAVFDKDDFPPAHFDNAIHSAHKKGIKVAWSNECIELWFLLHFAYLDSNINRQQYYSRLDNVFKNMGIQEGYNKASERLYELLKPHQDKAIRHAQKLRKTHSEMSSFSKKAPCTNVDELVCELRGLLHY